MGLNRIWRTVKSLSSRIAGSCTNRGTDLDSPSLRALREELVCSGIAPFVVPMITNVDDVDPMN